METFDIPGIPEFMELIGDTGCGMYACKASVDLFGFTGHFAAIYGADLAGRLDDKAHLLAHLAQEERVDPTAAIMIGDRAHDIRAARHNGAGAIGVLWGYGSREELADADSLAAAPHELASLLVRVREARR